MVATAPTTTPHLRNGSLAGSPHMMETPAQRYVAGFVIRVTDNGLSGFIYDRTRDPLDSASYTVVDLSANATVVAALALTDPGNGVKGIIIEDNHFVPGCGIDDQGRMWLAGDGHADPQRVCFSDAVGGVPDLTSWNTLTWASMPWSASGSNFHTYNQFHRMSDGRLIWIFDQQDGPGSRGRDVLAYYLPLGRTKAQIQAGGTSGWRPVVDTATGIGPWTGYAGTSRGEIINTAAVGDSPAGIGGGPDPGPANRAYINAIAVERRPSGDRLWITFLYRTCDVDARSSQQVCIAYTDSIGLNTLGAWRNVDGLPVTMPFHWDNRAEVLITPQPGRTLGTNLLAIKDDGRPVLIVQNGVQNVGTTPGYGAWVRLERIADVWVMTNLGTTSQGHPAFPQIVYAADHQLYTITTATGLVRMRTDGGNVGGPSGTIPNGQSPAGGTWQKGGPILASGTIHYGSTTATDVDAFQATVDPVTLSRCGRVDLLIPDGDQPRIYSFGNHARIRRHT